MFVRLRRPRVRRVRALRAPGPPAPLQHGHLGLPHGQGQAGGQDPRPRARVQRPRPGRGARRGAVGALCAARWSGLMILRENAEFVFVKLLRKAAKKPTNILFLAAYASEPPTSPKRLSTAVFVC